MARRGRGAGSARTKTTPAGRPSAANGSANGMLEPGDEPGARTIGALALKRFVARGAGRGESDGDGGGGPVTHGPFDQDDLDPEHAAAERVDFGAVQVPVPRGGEVSVEPEDGRLQAVHVMLPAGRLSVSALAAPRTGGLWPDLAAEIDESLREGGATVRSFTGEWGRELHARTGDASSLFVGVDGPRWMLYGVATGPTGCARELDAALRVMLRGTVVVRGRSPYPVRTVLPLTVPEHLSRPGPIAMPDRVPMPRVPAEHVPAPPPPPARPAVLADEPTTVTVVPDDLDTVPHGIPRRIAEPVADAERSDAGRPARGPAVRGRDAAAEEHPAVSPGASEGEAQTEVTHTDVTQTEVTQTDVTRTASRGLFRRRPDRPARPAARPPQRRVSELLAQAERDRAAAERPGPAVERTAGPTRPGRSGAAVDDPDRGTSRPAPGGTSPGSARGGPSAAPHEHRPPNGHASHSGYASNGASYGTNGTSYWANGADYGPSREEPAAHDVPPHRSDDKAPQVNGSYMNGSYVNGTSVTGTSVNGGYVNGAYASDGPYADTGYEDDSSPPAWPGVGATGYGRSGSYADEPFTGAGSTADDPGPETSWYGPERPVSHDRPFGPDPGVGIDRMLGPERGFAAGREFGADRDHQNGSGDDTELWIEATVWASVLGSGAAPAGEVADSGADDWTVPIPVVRAAPVPEPEPARPERVHAEPVRPEPVRPEPVRPEPVRPGHVSPDPVAATPRSRRARRAADERAAGSQGWMSQPRRPEPGAAEAWTSERWRPAGRPDGRAQSEWAGSGWEAAGRSAHREPDRGAHATDRPRNGGHRALEPGDDPAGRAARRHASAHGRHSDERDDPADRPRHRRPEH